MFAVDNDPYAFYVIYFIGWAGQVEERLLNHLLACCQEQKRLKTASKQRTDSTYVLARIRTVVADHHEPLRVRGVDHAIYTQQIS